MENSNMKKATQLGMPQGTAANRLRKMIVFDLLVQLDKTKCYQCGEPIVSHKELSIEHKVPYLDSEDPKKLFFDLDNIAFSHLTCNVKSSRRDTRYKHPSKNSYQKGCRCTECKSIHAKSNSDWRKKKRMPV